MTTVRAVADNKRFQVAKRLGCLLAVQFGLGLLAQSAFAEDVAATSSPSTQVPGSSATSTAVPNSQATPAAPSTPVSAAPSTPAPSAPVSSAAVNDGPLVEPGPAEAKRTALVLRIFNAKAQGIGIDAYLNAFAMLENSVKTGETEANLNKRIDSLNSSLDDQLKRSAVLKTQRPAPPVAASGFPAGGLGGGGSSGGGTSDLIRKLQEKYGDQIPANLKDKLGAGGQIPDNLKDKIPAGLGGLDPSQIEDLIKKYKK